MQNYFLFFALLSIFSLFLTASLSRFNIEIGRIKGIVQIVSAINVVGAVLSGMLLILNGPVETGLIGISGLGFSLRLDAVSAIMFLMIALLSVVILKFSINYLDGDQRQAAFLGRLAAALGSVELLVLSGNLGILLLAWIITSLSLSRLLVFYRERPGAIVAAKKKFIVARLSDFSLLLAVLFIYNQFGTGDLGVIFGAIANLSAIPSSLEIACVFLALAAIFKSAQFPTHGWLIEVMETPTPVSALLHAGLINAGPFLIVRFAYLFETVSYASVLLMVIGAITAIFGSLVFLTQTSIKTTLAYSSVAHMGFSLMMCGFGAYPAAMLHLVAHSFYKAHSFLSSGSVIDSLRASKGFKLIREGNPLKILLGIFMALIFYVGIYRLMDFDLTRDFHLIFISGIIVLGLVQLLTSAVDSAFNSLIILRTVMAALYVTGSFILFENAFSHLMIGSIPDLVQFSIGEITAATFIFAAFALIVLAQVSAPMWAKSPAYAALAIHLKNGLYINTLFDRMIGALKISVPVINLSEAEQFEKKELNPELVPMYEKQ